MDPRAIRLLWTLLPACLVLGIIYLSVFGDNGLIRRHRLEVELARVERRLVNVETESALLRREVDQLQHDPVTLRRAVARDLLLVPPGSTVYRLQP